MRKTALRKRSKSPRSIAEQRAVRAFSTYIRTRDCIATTGSPDRGRCFTCDDVHSHATLQAGHFVRGIHPAVKFDEQDAHAQCVTCNEILGGNVKRYGERMCEVYGMETVERLQGLRWTPVKRTIDDFRRIERKYKAKTAELLAQFA